MSPLLQIEDLDLYADDNYLGHDDASLEKLLPTLQLKVNRITKWIKDSGLKINAKKTEFVLFHARKTATASIFVEETNITSKSTMTILGIIFDENLTWSEHIESAILKTKKATYGLKKLTTYLNINELQKVATCCVFSNLYYGGSVFLHPGLNSQLLRRLISVSANIIKVSNKLMGWNLVSFKDLHALAGLLTPLKMSYF